MLLQILTHTPPWVFALFALLAWLGGKQLFAGRVGLARVTAMPLAMTGLSVYGVLSAFGDSPLALAGWALAAALLGTLMLRRPVPAGVAFDARERSFQMPGSAMPLALMMGIFFTKYAVGVALALHPGLAPQPALAIGVSTLYGAFSGMFAGRGLRLLRLALRAGRAAQPAVA